MRIRTRLPWLTFFCIMIHAGTSPNFVKGTDQDGGGGGGGGGGTGQAVITPEVRELGREVERLYAEWRQTRDPGLLAKAIISQREISRSLPKDFDARLMLANLLYFSGNEAEAEVEARRSVEQQRNNPHANKLLGRILVQISRHEEGLPFLEHAVALLPGDYEGWYKLGAVLFEMGQKDEAGRCFAAAGRMSGDVLHLLSAAHAFHKAKRDRQAFSLYAAAAKAGPTSIDVWHDFSFALSERQMYAEAEWAARKAVAIKETGDSLFMVANHVMGQKRFREACEIYENAHVMSPKSMDIAHNLGYCQHLSGSKVRAVEAALRTCELAISADGTTAEGKDQSPMYIAGLASALRRNGMLDLSVAVLASLVQPTAEEMHAKIIINDNLRVHTVIAVRAIAAVRDFVDSEAAPPALALPVANSLHTTPIDRSPDMVDGAVITYLIGNKTEHYLDLVDSLTSLHIHFLARLPYPVVVFHEGLGAGQMEELRRLYANVLFHRLDRAFLKPPNIDLSSVPKIIGGHASVGYRHMCRFFSGSMFNYPLLAEYKWFWRLDSDSFILGPIKQDPFARMRDGKHVYGYMGIGREDDYLTTGLWPATKEYMTSQGIKETPRMLQNYINSQVAPEDPGEWDRSYFYTNFEIGYLPFFRSREYQAYFHHLEKLGGFYHYRWGDAPIRLLGVSIHAKPEDIYRFTDIPYSHKVFVILPESKQITG